MIFLRPALFLFTAIKNWLLNVVEYFRFVQVRRAVSDHRLFPAKGVTLPALAVIATIIGSVHFLFDTQYLEWFLTGDIDRDGVFSMTTDIGKADWILFVAGFALVVFSSLPFHKVSSAHRVQFHHQFLKIYFLFTAIAFSGLLAIAFKNLIGRARPRVYEGIDASWISSPFTDTYLYASFPSGHSTTVGALAMVLILVLPRLGWLFLPVAIWVAISRAMVGAHFPSDIMAGLSLGAVFTFVYARSFARKRLLFEFSGSWAVRLREDPVEKARQKIGKNGGESALSSQGQDIEKASHK